MPRSVNHVASRAKETDFKLTRGYYGARKNVWTVRRRIHGKKGLTYDFPRPSLTRNRNFQ